MTKENFSACLAHVLRYEGGYVDHVKDPGGATNKGITRKTLAHWRAISPWQNLPKSEVQNLSDGEIAQIYRSFYWQRCCADQLPPGVDLALFDFAVNSGPRRAVRYLQSVLKVSTDGYVGPVTLAAIDQISNKTQLHRLIRTLCRRRMGFLRRLKIFDVFGRGWTRRVRDVESQALKMCADFKPISPKRKKETKMDLLSGYKTYITGGLMILSALAQLMGIDLPGVDNQSSMQLLMEGFAIVFLRNGVSAQNTKS